MMDPDELLKPMSVAFRCRKMLAEHSHRIRTPFTYPDGDNIDLYCRTINGTYHLSDLGETVANYSVRQPTAGLGLSEQYKSVVREAVDATFGVCFDANEICVEMASPDNLPEAVIRLSQACIAVSYALEAISKAAAPDGGGTNG